MSSQKYANGGGTDAMTSLSGLRSYERIVLNMLRFCLVELMVRLFHGATVQIPSRQQGQRPAVLTALYRATTLFLMSMYRQSTTYP